MSTGDDKGVDEPEPPARGKKKGPTPSLLAVARRALVPGELFEGRYRIHHVLGKGGMGAVYEAHDIDLDRKVAVKVAHRDTPAEVKLARKEARSLGKLQHPNIVRIENRGVTKDGILYFVLELLDGEPMRLVMLKAVDPFPADDALTWGVAIANALVYAHKEGVIHRDLKPENIIVLANGDLKLIDFGLARVSDAVTSDTKLVKGTAQYMAPEQILGNKPIDGRTDVYALGLVLHELMGGRHALAIDDELMPHAEPAKMRQLALDPPLLASLPHVTVSRALSDLVARALAKDIDARPTMAEMAASLAAERRKLLLESGDLGRERSVELPLEPEPAMSPEERRRAERTVQAQRGPAASTPPAPETPEVPAVSPRAFTRTLPMPSRPSLPDASPPPAAAAEARPSLPTPTPSPVAAPFYGRNGTIGMIQVDKVLVARYLAEQRQVARMRRVQRISVVVIAVAAASILVMGGGALLRARHARATTAGVTPAASAGATGHDDATPVGDATAAASTSATASAPEAPQAAPRQAVPREGPTSDARSSATATAAPRPTGAPSASASTAAVPKPGRSAEAKPSQPAHKPMSTDDLLKPTGTRF